MAFYPLDEIHVHVSTDGYLFGATIDPAAGDVRRNFRYWHPAGGCQEDACYFETWLIEPRYVADLEAQGTSEQWFEDGYKAYSFLREAGIKANRTNLASAAKENN